MRNIRDYGLGNSSKPVGIPIVDREVRMPCPNCGCRTVYQISIAVENPSLKGGKGIGTYIGCAACPFASPMIARAEGFEEEAK